MTSINITKEGEVVQILISKRVRKLLTNLNEFKSARPDKIYHKVLKKLAEHISEPLAKVFANSWVIGEIPED